MSTDTTPDEAPEVSLDDFSTEFFGKDFEEIAEPASPDAPEDAEESSDAPQDTQPDVKEEESLDSDDLEVSEDDDTLAQDDESEEDKEAEPPKPKKSRYQERIDELTGKQREAERRASAAELKLEVLEKLNKDTTPEPEPTQRVDDTGPTTDDKNEDGTAKYPLGDYDPNYIKDLHKHAISSEREAQKALDTKEREQQEINSEREALTANWNEQLGPAKERYPDFEEKGQSLIETFSTIDQAYGEYLTSSLMSMDYGTDVLYYLANNPDVASEIVESGPQKATLAMGRIEAKFADAADEKARAKPKVSKAPTPPTHLNKGSSAARGPVKGDTDDLEAFSKQFFG